MSFSNAEKHRCAQRELALRYKVYPKRVKGEYMTQKEADYQIAVMAQIVLDYRVKAEQEMQDLKLLEGEDAER